MRLEKLKYSDEFKTLLNEISDDKISNILLKIQDKLFYLPFNNIDYIKDTNQVTIELFKKVGSTKSNIRIGKFITKLFKLIHSNFDNSELEVFVNRYKSISEFDRISKNFKIVYGKDILKYYHKRNYSKKKGILGKSCMRKNKQQKFLKLYSKNINKIGMLVLFDDNGKIKGRSILWKDINMEYEEGKYKVNFMDRIYTYDDYITEQFKLYAKMNGWVYKSSQNFLSYGFIFNNKELNNVKFDLKLKKFKKLKHYPYMDTMDQLSRENGKISNYEFDKSVSLSTTDGGYTYN